MGEILEIVKLGGLNVVTWLLLLYMLQELKRVRDEIVKGDSASLVFANAVKNQLEKDLEARFGELNKSLDFRHKVYEDEIRDIKHDIRELQNQYRAITRA